EPRERFANRVLGAHAVEALRAWIPRRDGPVGPPGHDRVAEVAHDVCELAEHLLVSDAVGDVLADAEQVLRAPARIHHRDLARVQDALALVLRVDRLGGDVDDLAFPEGLSVLLVEEVGLLAGVEVMIRLAEELAAREAQELLSCAIETPERERLG